VDEASANVKAEAQQPQDYQNRENCPKHVAPSPLTTASQQRLAGNSGTSFIAWGHSRVSPLLLTRLVKIAHPG
jgi:hypothetical protein